ncbi:MAG: dihydrolipoamide acetyltransferase family protein [Candidatus Promineifilaceae bacterium]|nr:dihydrolipoamide acetyltransferase family protein [Candidatus Promineifilaceae bacterium]
MAEYIVMPKLGFDMREGVLNQWLKDVGDSVARGEVVAEIESDKATLDLESQVEGVLLKVLQEDGAVVPVGAQMAIVGAQGEDISNLAATNGDSEELVEEAAREPAQGTSPAAAQEAAPATEAQDFAEFPGGVRATPVARRIASEHDLNLQEIQGTGPNGRIRKADVEEFLASPAPGAAPAPAVAEESAVLSSEAVETSRLRQAIGRRMSESKVTVPHFYVTTEVDMAPALALRKEINNALPADEKVTVNDLIVKASALALRDFPNLNASFAKEKLLRHKDINIGTAVAVEGGLLTIVQKNTDTSTLSKVAVDNKAAISRAREGRVKPDDIQGSTFTVSNLGAFDVDHFIAIINPPEAAILAVGSAKQVPVVVDGELTIGTRMKVTLSADHRVTDGAEAAQFLQTLKAIMENPMRLLL